MVDWDDEFADWDDDVADDEDSEDGEEPDDDSIDYGEDGEDHLAMEAFDAFMDVEGDSEIAQASREALAAITNSALDLKTKREARERRVALEQAAEQERQEEQARKEEERARREVQQRAERRARAERDERAQFEQEAQQLALDRERLQLEQERFEIRRREEKSRRAAAPKRIPAHVADQSPVEPERTDTCRRRYHDRPQVRRGTEPSRQVVSRSGVEANEAPRRQRSARDEQKRRDPVRRDAKTRADRRDRPQSAAAQAPTATHHSFSHSQKKPVQRRKTNSRQSGAPKQRARNPTPPSVKPPEQMRAVPPSPPRSPSPPSRPRPPRPQPTPRPELQQVASDFKSAVATATADLLRQPSRAEPSNPRLTRHPKRAALTGADLAGWRSRLGLTQQAAAKRLGVGQGTVSKAESKGGAPLGPTLLRALASALAQE